MAACRRRRGSGAAAILSASAVCRPPPRPRKLEPWRSQEAVTISATLCRRRHPHGRMGKRKSMPSATARGTKPCPQPMRRHLLLSVRVVLTCSPSSFFAAAAIAGAKSRPKRPRSAKQGDELREENPQLPEHDDGLLFSHWILFASCNRVVLVLVPTEIFLLF